VNFYKTKILPFCQGTRHESWLFPTGVTLEILNVLCPLTFLLCEYPSKPLYLQHLLLSSVELYSMGGCCLTRNKGLICHRAIAVLVFSCKITPSSPTWLWHKTSHLAYPKDFLPQQRVALARALASQPEALLLDEPFSALDTHLRSQLEQQMVGTLANYEGVTLFVTHNRSEAYRICPNLLVLEDGKAVHSRLAPDSIWLNLKSVGMVESVRQLDGKTTIETRYFISSLEDNAKKFANCVRSHGGIENSWHWLLDIALKEDDCRIRKDNAPQNFAVMRQIAVNLLGKENRVKRGIKNKQFLAAMDNKYLERVLALA
jgi:predicted transposase YbfD/YdcC